MTSKGSSAKFRRIKHRIRCKLQAIKSQLAIEGFYYYVYPEDVGNRSKGWLMFAADAIGQSDNDPLMNHHENDQDPLRSWKAYPLGKK